MIRLHERWHMKGIFISVQLVIDASNLYSMNQLQLNFFAQEKCFSFPANSMETIDYSVQVLIICQKELLSDITKHIKLVLIQIRLIL